jgi:FixJ family two-component response regulator
VSASHPLIAVVDDEEEVRRALGRLIRSAGLEIETFMSGADFLESLAHRRPAFVVLDLHMPGVNGFEVQSRLNEMPDPIPVIVITGRDTEESRQRALEGGARAYLRKPVDERDLFAALASVMGPKG